METGDSNALGGPEEIDGPFLINLMEPLVAAIYTLAYYVITGSNFNKTRTEVAILGFPTFLTITFGVLTRRSYRLMLRGKSAQTSQLYSHLRW